MTPAEWREKRRAEWERIAWRCDVLAAIEREYDDEKLTDDAMAAKIGITRRQLVSFLDYHDVGKTAEERLRKWAGAQDVPPVSLEFVAMMTLVWRLPPRFRFREAREMHQTLYCQAFHVGVEDYALSMHPLGTPFDPESRLSLCFPNASPKYV